MVAVSWLGVAFDCVGASIGFYYYYYCGLDFAIMNQPPNKSPEPTPVGAVSSAARFTVFRPAWLSFFR